VGAAVFDALESEFELEERKKLFREEEALKSKYNISDDDYRNLTRNVIDLIPHKSGIQWKFAGAFYFATTVITTIGYGHSAPHTFGGKYFCMVYALAGIPLGLVMFQSIGERLNTFVTFILQNIKKCLKFKNTEVTETNLIMVSLNINSVVMLGGAAVYSHMEGWDYWDCLYYCFITLTTIGFGDFTALQQPNDLQRRPLYVAFTLIFILFGLVVLSAAMNLLVLRFMTMNTEDERRQEIEAAAAARTAVHLEGDIITANGNIISGQQELMNPEYSDLTSVCSCSCYSLRGRGKSRYSVTRSPGKINHLLGLPLQNMRASQVNNDMTEELYTFDNDTNSMLNSQYLRQKRASI